MKKPLVVLDSNVIVSAILYHLSKPGEILQSWHEDQFRLAISSYIIHEVEYTLAESRISIKYHLEVQDVKFVLDQLQNRSKLAICWYVQTVGRRRIQKSLGKLENNTFKAVAQKSRQYLHL